MSRSVTLFSGSLLVIFALVSLQPCASHAAEAIAGNEFTITAIDATAESRVVLIRFTPGTGISYKLKDSQDRPPIRFIPPVSIDWWDDRTALAGGDALRIVGSFKPGTTYRISLPKDFRNTSARSYHATLNTFRMPDLKPVVAYGLFKTTIERDSRQMVHLDLTNVNEVLYEGVCVPPILAADAKLLAATSLEKASLATLAAELEKRLSFLKPVLDTNPDLAVFGKEARKESHLFFAQARPNALTPFSVPLTFREEKEKGAIQVIQFKDNRSGSEAMTKPSLYRITDLSLAAKVSGANLLIWATSLHTGKPLEDISLLASNFDGDVFSIGKTGADGILLLAEGTECPGFRFPLDNQTPVVTHSAIQLGSLRRIVAASPRDCTLLDLSDSRMGIKQDMDNDYSGMPAPDPAMKASLFTERGVYRPGETVYFKATLREFREGSIAIPAISSCTLEILDPEGEVVDEQGADVSEFGTSNGVYEIPSYASVGTYTLCLKTRDQSPAVSQTTFQVQEFRPPRHYAGVRFRREKQTSRNYVNLRQDEDVLVATLSGRYYAGGPLKHGQVRWMIFSTSSSYSLDEYPHFRFGYDEAGNDRYIESGESILNESGEVEVRLPLSQEVLAGRHGLRISATVIDFDGRTATDDETFSIRPDIVVGISEPPQGIQDGNVVPCKVVVLDKDRRQIQEGSINLRVMNRTGFYVRKRSENGDVYWTWDEMWKREQILNLDLKEGQASTELSFRGYGDYLVECIFKASDGIEYRSGVTCAVSGYYHDWELGDEDRGPLMGDIQVQCDQPEYGVGDTARIRLLSPEPLSSCLLSVEREGVLEYHLVPVEEEMVQLTIPAAFKPNVHVNVLGVIGRGEFPVYQGQYDREAPRFYFGKTSLKVKETHESLQVTIAPDQKDLKSYPGGSISLALKVADSSGKGVQAELAVAVVDEQVLALTAFKTPNLTDLLRYVFPDSVRTLEGRRDVLLQTPFEEIRNEPLTGGGGNGGEGVGIQLREDFNPTAYFNPTFLTNSEGNAVVNFDLPDTMTTYRIYVIACDKGERFASSERPLLVVKDFYLEPGLPRFLNQGDEISFSVAAFNKTDQEQPISFSVTSDPALSMSSPSQNYAGKPMDRVLIPVTAKALKAGESKITFTGILGELSDAVGLTMPIHSGFPRQNERIIKTLTQSGSIDFKFPLDVTTIPVEDLSGKDLSFILTLSGSPFLKISSGLRYLLQYPYGCAEQTSSGVLPLAALRSLIVDGQVPGITLDETDEYLKKGIERLLTMQTDEGGFAYWPSNYQVSNWATLYATFALIAARDAGMPVDEGAIEDACNYISSNIIPADTSRESRDHTEGLAAYIVSRNDSLSNQSLQSLWSAYDKYSRENRLLILLAAESGEGIPRDERIKRLQAELSRPSSGEDYSPFNASSREPAVALMACAQILEPTIEAGGDKLAAELLERGKSEGRWNSTSDTGWALLALGQHFRQVPFTEKKMTGLVTQSGLAAQPFSVEGTKSVTLNLDARKFLTAPKVEITLEGKGALFAQLDAVYPRVDFAKTGGGEGFEIHKAIENTAGTPDIHVGDVVKVKITLTPKDSDPHYLVLDDPLPGGLVAINSALANEEPVELTNDDDRFNYWDSEGFYRLIPNHFEFRDDRVLVFRDDLWNQQFQYSYYARAVCAGKFRIPPTKVQLMYHPERCAYTPETQIEIKER